MGFPFIFRHGWIVALFLLAGFPLHAWDPEGHLIVATIAYDQLNPKAKAEAQVLAAQIMGPQKAYDPITIACWMDDLRTRDSTLPYHGLFLSWHYIDIGLEPGDPVPALVPGTDNEIKGNIVTALKRAQVVLRGGTDPYIKSKAMAYAMIVHLVGDIHQPLHAAAYFHRESGGRWFNDAGGNKEAIIDGPFNERTFNLHNFWDEAWRVSFDEAGGRVLLDPKYESWNHPDVSAIHALAEELEAGMKPAPTAHLETDFEAWARESNQIARESVYSKLTFTENHKTARISDAYVAMANPLARQRLTLAGYRLAALLNATLGADVPVAVPPSYPAGPPAMVLSDH